MSAFLRSFTAFACLVFIVPCVYAQKQDSIALSNEYHRMGMEIFDYTHRKQATELFVLATQANPANANAQLMAGKSIMLTIRKELSLNYFKKAYKLNNNIDPEILFFLGQAYQYSEKFDSAVQYYDAFNRQLARSMDKKKSAKTNELNRKIFECRNAIIYMANPVNVTITNLDRNINSEWPDYAPTITADESLMVFTSRRPEDNANASLAVDHEYFEEIYYARNVNGKWEEAKNIGAPLNTKYHDANVNLSPDGKEMLLYNDENGGDIFASYLGQTGWSDPEPLGGINSQYLENSASITSDGQRIYFTSSRPGGLGGTDIYMATKNKNGNWTDVKNLGDVINTELDEDGVFISASGRHLYFSSNGQAGMGDLDIYRSAYDSVGDRWEKPVNMGYPINSVENDIYFVLSRDEQFAYISSVRQENIGEQDIYKVDMKNWKPVDIRQPEFAEVAVKDAVVKTDEIKEGNKDEVVKTIPVPVKLELLVLDENTNSPLEVTAELFFKRKKIMDFQHRGEGKYELELSNPSEAKYEVVVTRPSYLPHTSAVYFFGQNQKKLELWDTVHLKKNLVSFNCPLNVYFHYNNEVPLSYGGIRELLKMMKDAPTAKTEIAGHTDNLGSAEYNLDLSRRRAEAVKKYLVNAGIDASRITAVGYGEEKPIAENTTDEGRRMNRRTVFTIY